MKPIKRPDIPSPPVPEPPAHSIASLRTKMRMGHLPQAQSSSEQVDQREPDELFEPLPPSDKEPNEYTLNLDEEQDA